MCLRHATLQPCCVESGALRLSYFILQIQTLGSLRLYACACTAWALLWLSPHERTRATDSYTDHACKGEL
jgi:hypothetical protein